jgi:hypothetical protein
VHLPRCAASQPVSQSAKQPVPSASQLAAGVVQTAPFIAEKSSNQTAAACKQLGVATGRRAQSVLLICLRCATATAPCARIAPDVLCAAHGLPYAGWTFESSGRCTSIPQISNARAHTVACANRRACIKSYPTQAREGTHNTQVMAAALQSCTRVCIHMYIIRTAVKASEYLTWSHVHSHLQVSSVYGTISDAPTFELLALTLTAGVITHACVRHRCWTVCCGCMQTPQSVRQRQQQQVWPHKA